MAQEVTIPLGTKATLNGIEVEFTTDAMVEINALSIDHVAELFAGARLDVDLSHKEDGKLIRYGAAGKRFEVEPEPKPEKAKKPDTEKPDTVKKGTKPKGTKAKPKG